MNFKDFLNESYKFELNESATTMKYTHFKKGDKLEVVLKGEDDKDVTIKVDVEGYAFVSIPKVYNKSAAIYDDLDDLVKVEELNDLEKNNVLKADNYKGLLSLGFKLVDNGTNKRGDKTFAMITYQSGPSSSTYGYSRTGTIAALPGDELVYCNDKEGTREIKSIKKI
jgi:hypothetical protein